MAVLNLACGGGKENWPPLAAGVRRHQAMKRPGGASSKAPRSRRPPLRDITGLILAAARCPPGAPRGLGQQEDPALVLPATALPEVARATGAPVVEQGRYSLRKGFR